MTKSNQSMGRRFAISRAVGAIVAMLLVCGALLGCGGVQPPPQEGTCREWREWVEPHQDDNGDWVSGYCRDRE